MSRRKARELAFQVLFQVDQVDAEPRQAFDYLVRDKYGSLDVQYRMFSWKLVEGCLEKLPEIDARIARYSRDWEINRMPSVDRNIMRVAAYEILYMENSQEVVAIDEAIEIAKKYGDEGSAGFVNAILDKILGEKK